MNEAVQQAETAANLAVETATAAAQTGTTIGQTGYELMQQMLNENQPALVLPLLALSTEAITAGLAAYTATVASAKAIGVQVETAMAAAEARVKQQFAQAQQSLE